MLSQMRMRVARPAADAAARERAGWGRLGQRRWERARRWRMGRVGVDREGEDRWPVGTQLLRLCRPVGTMKKGSAGDIRERGIAVSGCS